MMENNQRDKISIVVPVYNAEDKLNRCVESLRSQLYSDIEIILVNDGSKDNSLSICKYYEKLDERIIVIDKPNGGVSSARNAGIDVASGKYIMFCDSDDWVYDDYCLYMIEHAVNQQLTMCGYEEITNETQKPIVRSCEDDIEEFSKTDFLRYREQGIGSPWNKLFELKIINEHGIKFPEIISLGEDLAFVMEYLKHMNPQIIYLHRKLYVYQNEETATLSKRVPSVLENETFFNLLSDGVRNLSDNDGDMFKLRNQIIMRDYEKTFMAIAVSSQQMLKIYQEIKKAMDTFSYQTCCQVGVGSSNKLYDWMFRKRKAGLLSIYLKLKNLRRM